MAVDMAKLAELIVTIPCPEDPQLSPDGQWVAWVAAPLGQAAEHAQASIWLASVDSAEPARRLTWSEGRDHHPRWSPDDTAIAFLSDRRQRGISGLWVIDASGGEGRPLVERKHGIVDFAWAPSGDRIAFLAPDEPTPEDERRERERDDAEVYGERWPFQRLFVIDTVTQAVTMLSTGEVHVVELAWSPDGSHIAYVAAATPEIETRARAVVWSIEVSADRVAHVCDAPGWGLSKLQWTPDESHLVFMSSHEVLPQASSTVYVVDAAGGTPRVLGPAANEEACAGGLAVPADGRPVAAIAHGLATDLVELDLSTGNRTPIYAPERGDGRAFSVVSPDGERVLALVKSSGLEPPEIWAGVPHQLRRLSDHHAPLREYRFGAQEPFFWEADDGLALDGVLIRPPDATDAPLPTIVLVHGGPYSRTTDGWNLQPLNWGQWLATSGYAVLMPNYRGGAGHGNGFATAARGAVGLGDFGDVMSAVDAAVERGIADPGRLGIGGWSQGGFMTAWAVTQTGRFRGAVMGAGVSDWGMMSMTSDMPTFESVLGGSRPWDGPGPHQHAAISPISYAAHATAPTLILHGKEDVRVPVSQAIGFARALRDAGTTVELVVYPREPHGIRERAHQRDILCRVLGWYDCWLREA